jgi:hypothetical protein
MRMIYNTREIVKELKREVYPATLGTRVVELLAAKYLELQEQFTPEVERITAKQQVYINYGSGGRRPSKRIPLADIPVEHRELFNRISLLKAERQKLVNQLTDFGYERVDWVDAVTHVEQPCSLEEFEAMKTETKRERDEMDARWNAAMNDLVNIAKSLAKQKVKETRSKLPVGLVEKLDAITVKQLPAAQS